MMVGLLTWIVDSLTNTLMYIGEREIENKQISEAPNGVKLVEVEYKDGLRETLTELMYNATVAPESCDATTLRDKRVQPVVQGVLGLMRDWGIRMSELPYFSAVLNTSLAENEKQALLELWRPWIATLNNIDDIDLVAVDRVLRSKKDNETPHVE